MTTTVAIICIVAALVVGVVLGTFLGGITGVRHRRRPVVGSSDHPVVGSAAAPDAAAGRPPGPADEPLSSGKPQDGEEQSQVSAETVPLPEDRPSPAVGATVAGGAPLTEVTVPAHPGEDTPPGTVAEMSTQAEMSADSGADLDRQGRILDAVWQLQCLDVELDRRRQAGLSTADADSGGPDLAQAVQQEITRIREEIGTPGTFHSYLDAEPDPAAAVLVLRSVRSTLEIVARRAQAFDLELRRHDGRLAATVLCDDFEGGVPTTSIDLVAVTIPTADDAGVSEEGVARLGGGREATVDGEAAAIADAVALAGGSLVFDVDVEGRVRASLSVPVG